jgi:hypothetical protein
VVGSRFGLGGGGGSSSSSAAASGTKLDSIFTSLTSSNNRAED